MPDKQIPLILENELFKKVEALCELEDRSLTKQIRHLFRRLPSMETMGMAYVAFRKDFVIPHYKEIANTVGKRTMVKFSEEEYWDLKAKASVSHLTPGEFIVLILKLWVDGVLDNWISAKSWETPESKAFSPREVRRTA